MSERAEAPRLLLVEAHDGLRIDLTRALEASGYRVDAMRSPAELPAFEVGPRYAVNILDAAAFESPGSLDRVDPNPGRTLWMVAGMSEHARSGLRIQPGAAVVTKPFSIHALESRIEECVVRAADSASGLLDPILRTREPGLATSLERARRLSGREVPIVIEGELGTGRRALAYAIHAWSARGRESSCLLEQAEIEAAGPSRIRPLVENLWQQARRGSLLISEPADWPDWAQQAFVSLLGCSGDGPRLLTIARSPLERSVDAGKLALEIQYRLDAARISLPSLRERPLDHLDLCTAIARRVARSLGRSTPAVDALLVDRLARDGFPGNRIGLESRLRSALIRSDEGSSRIDSLLDAEVGQPLGAPDTTASLNLKTLERDTIVRALAHWQGNRTRAAESLGISVRTLRNKIREYALR